MNVRESNLLELANCCEILAIAQKTGDYPAASTAARAAALARELFPPMAKPLVWVTEQNGQSYGRFCDGATLYECGTCAISAAQHYAHSRVDGDVFHGLTRDAVKAACEAHHQARFLEQLA